MDHSKYIHDAQKVQAYIRELGDGRLVTTKGLKIVTPVRFAERGLAYVGIETRIVGIFALIVEDQYYGVSIANAMMRITPSSTNRVTYDDDEYYEFTFDPGATIVPATMLVKVDTLVYNIYDEILAKGRVPWYMKYEEMGQVFDTAYYHAGASIGQQPEVTELMVSLVSRSETDRAVYYRQVVKTEEDLLTQLLAFIPLRSVAYAATNTLNKLAGSYAKDGLISALVTPTDRVERIEALIRA